MKFFFCLSIIIFYYIHFSENSTCSIIDSLKGTWMNELGSKMIIHSINIDEREKHYNNTFNGIYESAVGDAKGYYPLYGTFNYNNCSTSIGFNVIYSNYKIDSGSNAVWSGQIRCEKNQLIIPTTWLLNIYNQNKWDSTMIGQNIFKKERGAVCYF